MKILLGSLKDKGDDLAAFLEPRIGAKPDVGGGELSVEDSSLKKGIRSRHVKTYIKRFLSMQKLRADYRVLVEGGELRLVELVGYGEEKEEEEKAKKKEEEKAAEKETETESGSEESKETEEKPAPESGKKSE